MMTEAILLVLLFVVLLAWGKASFLYKQLTAYMAMKKVDPPTVEEWEIAAKVTWRSLFIWRKKK